jgi:hypothetical protein
MRIGRQTVGRCGYGAFVAVRSCFSSSGSKLPTYGPLPVWNNLAAHVVAGDVPGAVLSFSSATADGYRQAFLNLGTDSISDINDIGTLTPVAIRNDTAEYYFEQSIDGHLFLFPVAFVRENGVWKILQF